MFKQQSVLFSIRCVHRVILVAYNELNLNHSGGTSEISVCHFVLQSVIGTKWLIFSFWFFFFIFLADRFSLSCPWLGMKTWPDFHSRRPGSSTASLVWIWTTVWRTGSSTTPGAAVICHPGRNSPPFGTLLLTRRTGGWSCPSTWWFTLRLPANRFLSSSDTRQSSTPENWETSRTLWWRTGRSSHFFKQLMKYTHPVWV